MWQLALIYIFQTITLLFHKMLSKLSMEKKFYWTEIRNITSVNPWYVVVGISICPFVLQHIMVYACLQFTALSVLQFNMTEGTLDNSQEQPPAAPAAADVERNVNFAQTLENLPTIAMPGEWLVLSVTSSVQWRKQGLRLWSFICHAIKCYGILLGVMTCFKLKKFTVYQYINFCCAQ